MEGEGGAGERGLSRKRNLKEKGKEKRIEKVARKN